MTKVRTPHAVFISYATHDKARMRKVIKELMSRGVLDEGEKLIFTTDLLVPGANLRGQVRKAMEEASKVIVVWSGAAAESEWVNYETGMAEALGKPILVAVPKGERSRLPSGLADTRVIELDSAH